MPSFIDPHCNATAVPLLQLFDEAAYMLCLKCPALEGDMQMDRSTLVTTRPCPVQERPEGNVGVSVPLAEVTEDYFIDRALLVIVVVLACISKHLGESGDILATPFATFQIDIFAEVEDDPRIDTPLIQLSGKPPLLRE